MICGPKLHQVPRSFICFYMICIKITTIVLWLSDNQMFGDEANEALMYIKANPQAEDCKQIMINTVLYRKNVIEQSENFCDIMEKMPRLFDVAGFVSL